MDLPAVASGAPQRLAVHRDRPSLLVATLAVGQPCTDHPGQGVSVQAGQAPADGGLGWYREVAGGVAAGAQRGADRLWGILGPLGDRGHRPGAGQHRSGGHSQDRNQRVAAATPGSRVADRG
jgi:hypothetical protein